MKLFKLGYYINSLFKIIFFLKNPQSILLHIFNKKQIFIFNNNIFLQINQIIDLLIIKETIIDDDYHLKKLSDPKLIIDVGAGIGEFTIYASRLFPKASIIAFEPNKTEFETLNNNISLNKTDQIKSYNMLIGDKKKYDYLENYNYSQSSIYSMNRLNKQSKIKGHRLDKFINNKVDLLKIDCEGAEIDIINSISKRNLANIKQISIEYHNYIIKNEDKIITKYLHDNGFLTENISNRYDKTIGYIYAINKNN
jgi:FkbM family methyltransferase